MFLGYKVGKHEALLENGLFLSFSMAPSNSFALCFGAVRSEIALVLMAFGASARGGTVK